MHTQSDEALIRFNIGDIVKEIGKHQILTIIECKESMLHIHMEAVKTIYYKCQWRHPDGKSYSKWYNGNTLERMW